MLDPGALAALLQLDGGGRRRRSGGAGSEAAGRVASELAGRRQVRLRPIAV